MNRANKTCKTCRHWEVGEHRSFDERISPRHPVTWDQEDAGTPEGEAMIAQVWGHVVRSCQSPDLLQNLRPVKDGAAVCDGSNYFAQLLTGPDFGCVHHASKYRKP